MKLSGLIPTIQLDPLINYIYILFWVSLSIHSVYYFLIFPCLLFHRHHKYGEAKPVSVIIAAYNEENHLPVLLDALIKQTHPNFEVIVVNDRSDDNTDEVLQDYLVKMGNLKVININETPNGVSPKKHALTKGIEAASNEILLFTDADCTPLSDQWVDTFSKQHIASKNVIIGNSPLKTPSNLLGSIISFETFVTAIRYLSFAKIGLPYMGVGRNLSYTKEVFNANQGFQKHEHILSGDDDLHVQQIAKSTNTSICFTKESSTISPSPTTLSSWIKQKKRHLSTGKSYSLKISLILALEIISLFSLYFSSLYLIFSNYEIQTIMVTILLRTLLLFTTFTVLSMRFQQKSYWILLLPLLEFVYLLYYIIMSILVIGSKRVNWK